MDPTSTTAPGAPQAQAPGAKAATMQELKASLPHTTAEFREKCVEQGWTLQQSAIESSKESHAAAEQAKASGKRIGNLPVVTRGMDPAKAGETATSAKRQLMNLATQIQQSSGGRVARHDAWKQACAENPELRRDLVVAHNLKHGRKKQAAAFAEDFEIPERDADD